MARNGFLGLGGNVKDRRKMLQDAVDALPGAGVVPLQSSSVYLTTAVGGPPGQPDFLNACLRVQTELEPGDLLDALKAIEHAAGRPAAGRRGYVRHGPRPVDLDLLLLDAAHVETERLTVPHPALTRRRFVLVPLLELDFSLTLPGGALLSDALARLGTGEDVRRHGPPLTLAPAGS